MSVSSAYPTGRDGLPIPTHTEAARMDRERAAIADTQRTEQEAARERAFAQSQRAAEKRQVERAEHDVLLADWQDRNDRLVHTLHAALEVPILVQLREAREAVEVAEARIAEHEAVRP
jgi:phage gp29-like protein